MVSLALPWSACRKNRLRRDVGSADLAGDGVADDEADARGLGRGPLRSSRSGYGRRQGTSGLRPLTNSCDACASRLLFASSATVHGRYLRLQLTIGFRRPGERLRIDRHLPCPRGRALLRGDAQAGIGERADGGLQDLEEEKFFAVLLRQVSSVEDVIGIGGRPHSIRRAWWRSARGGWLSG